MKTSAFLLWFCFWPVIFDSALLRAEDTPSKIDDVTFVAKCDGTEQKYVLAFPKDFTKERPVDVLIALHGHGSDRWQFVRQDRPECKAVRDVASRQYCLVSELVEFQNRVHSCKTESKSAICNGSGKKRKLLRKQERGEESFTQ